MKYPILYEENEKVFTHLGLGPLTNTLKAHVVEERNGAFYLDMEVLVDDIKYPLLQEDRIIKVDAGHILKDQRFRIKKIVPKEDNKAEVYAEHVSYLAQELSLKPEAGAAGTADSAIKTWKGNIIDKNDFIVDSDITTVSSTTWKINEVKNAREALGGVKGSILDRWGGEYRFDNYHISLLKKRGKTAETLLAYGRNITDFEQERNIKNTYNAVYPFVVYRDDDKNDDVIFTLKDYIVDSKYVANYPNRKALPVDFSSEFKDGEKPTAEKLKRLAEQYIINNEIGVPTVSIKLKFIDLSKTLDYEELAPLEQLNLCDDVRIVYPKIGVDTVSKVIRVVWDHLTEKYYEIEIGQKRLTLSNIIRDQETAISEIHTETNYALLAANGKNTNFYGLYGQDGLGEPKAHRVDDTWFKPNGEHTEMYRWDGLVWKFIFSTAPDNSIIEKIEELEEISKETQDKADKAIEDAGFSKIEVGKIKEDFNNVQIEFDKLGEISIDASNKSNQALIEAEASRQTANEAKEQSFNSEQIANSAKQDALSAIALGDGNKTQIENLEGEQKLTNIKVEGNTADILKLETSSESLKLSIGKVQSDVDGIQIGATNLLKSSDKPIQSSQYRIGGYYLYEDWIEGVTYTLLVSADLEEDRRLGVWRDFGSTAITTNIPKRSDGLYSITFKCPKHYPGTDKNLISFYNIPSTRTSFGRVNWVMLVKGNKVVSHQIAPQELNTKAEFATFEANYKGFQFDVKNDLTGLHSQQTQMDGQISSVVEKVDNLNISNRNYVLDSKQSVKSTEYKIKSYKTSELWEVGKMYTVVIKGKTIPGNYFGVWRDLGNQILVDTKYNKELDLYIGAAVCPPPYTEATNIKWLTVFNRGNGRPFEAEIEWMMLIKGSMMVSDWSPAPEDNASKSEVIQLSDQITQTVTKIETVDTKVTQQQTQITQLSDQINSKVDKTDFDSLTGTVTQQGTEIAQLSDRITQTVTKIETVDGKVISQQTQINQMSDKIELVVKEQTELNTKYSKIEQTTDAIRSEVVEIGQAVADIGTYVNYLINADDFSDNLPYTIGMPGPPQVGLIGLEGTVMNKGTLKLYQRYNGDRFYSITDQNSSIPKDEDVTFSGHYKQLTLPCSIKLTVNRVTIKTLNLSGEQDFEFTFKIPKGATSYSLELAATGEARQESYFSKMKLNKGNKRVENTVDTASLNARISTVEQTANSLKTEVKDIQIDNGVMDGRISTVEQTANGLKTEVALIKDDQIVQSSQITQLSDNINLRVEKNKVVAQINISPETIRIQAKFIHLNGTSLIDNAVIKTAHIADLSVTGAKIQDASIANAKIINLDVDKISGNTTNFVQSNWNSISKSVSINANGLLISDSWQNAVSTIDSKGMTLHHNGIEVGTFMTGENQGDKTLHIQLMPKGKHIYIGHSHSDGTYGSFMTLKRGEKSANASYLRQSRITFFGHTEFLDSIVPFGWSGSTQDVPIRIGTTIGVNHKTGVLNDDLTSGITFSSGNAYLYHNFKEISFSQIFSKLGL